MKLLWNFIPHIRDDSLRFWKHVIYTTITDQQDKRSKKLCIKKHILTLSMTIWLSPSTFRWNPHSILLSFLCSKIFTNFSMDGEVSPRCVAPLPYSTASSTASLFARSSVCKRWWLRFRILTEFFFFPSSVVSDGGCNGWIDEKGYQTGSQAGAAKFDLSRWMLETIASTVYHFLFWFHWVIRKTRLFLFIRKS